MIDSSTFLLNVLDDSSSNKFIFEDDYYIEKKSGNVEEATLTYRLVNGHVGTIIDAFICYFVGVFGICTLDAIANATKSYKSRYKELYIGSGEEKDFLRRRVGILVQNGYLMSVICKYSEARGKADSKEDIYLYCIRKPALSLIRSVLQRNINGNDSMFTRHAYELSGHTLAARCASRCIPSDNFVDFLPNKHNFNTNFGQFYVPTELYFKRDETKFYVGFWYCYWIFDKRIHTDRSYKDYTMKMASSVMLFLNYRSHRNTDGVAESVIVVRNFEELKTFVSYILKVDYENALPHLYFTSESILNKNFELKQSFLSVKLDGRTKDGFTFVMKEPEFLQ